MRAKRNSFARIGILCVVLMVSLGFTGTAYGLWSKTLEISATLEMGALGVQLSPGECSPSEGETSISCNVANNALEVTVTNAQVGVDYSCQFNIENIATIPFDIESIVVSEVPAGVVVEIAGVAVGEQIDPGQTVVGTVNVHLADDTSQGQTFTFTVTISIVQWN